MRARPAFLLLLPALTFCILCTTGIVGVKLGADKYEADTRARAESVALDWVSGSWAALLSRCACSGMVLRQQKEDSSNSYSSSSVSVERLQVPAIH